LLLWRLVDARYPDEIAQLETLAGTTQSAAVEYAIERSGFRDFFPGFTGRRGTPAARLTAARRPGLQAQRGTSPGRAPDHNFHGSCLLRRFGPAIALVLRQRRGHRGHRRRHRRFMKSERGPPMTLGAAAAAGVRLIVWCRDCQHQVEPDPAEHARRYGAETSVLEWRDKLVCSRCGGRHVDMVVTGTRR
jgi:hypothetical protein